MFTFSKLIAFLINPFHLVLMCFFFGALWNRWVLGRMLTGAGIVISALLTITPLSEVAYYELETAYPKIDLPAQNAVAGVIILGGAQGNGMAAQINQTYTLNDAAERLTIIPMLRRARPDWPIILTGGSGSVSPRGWQEPQINKAFLTSQGLDPADFVMEGKSRNTFENATFTKALLDPEEKRPWLLVTSAFHMPRSVEIFETVGIAVQPYPVDFRIGEINWSYLAMNPTERFGFAELAMREFVSRMYFRFIQSRKLTGKSE